jgi:serine protease
MVAVVDSGIITDHPDLYNNLLEGADFVNGTQNSDPSNYNITDYDPTDETSESSHGTHVSGIIGAVGDNNKGVTGVNWSTNILPIRVLDASGNGTIWDVAEGIYYAVDKNADIINLSLGLENNSLTLENAVQEAYYSNIIISAAAGNSGESGVLYPARYEETIAVGAINKNKELAYFSNYGSYLDVVAPGYNIYSTCGYFDGYNTFSTYEYMSGTSMAAPYVSGVAALLLSKGVNPNNVRNRLTSTTVDLGSSGKDNYYGYGLVDAYGALINKRLRKPYVFAANIENGNLYVKSEMIRINDDGSYNLNQVLAEEVYIVGWRDVDENQEINAGDYWGVSSSSIEVAENSSYTMDVDIYYVTEESATSLRIKGLPK